MSYSKSFLFGLCFLFLFSATESSLGYDAGFQGRSVSILGQAVFSSFGDEGQGNDKPAPRNSWLIQGATIHTLTDKGTFVGDILVRKGKIAAMAPKIELRRPLPVIDATGMHAAPGFCESQTFFLLADGGKPSSQVRADVLDAFDYFDEERMEEALSGGVTSLCLAPAAASGFSGRASVVKLLPGGPLEEMVLKKDAALKAGVGSPAPGRTLSRLKSVEGLAKQLQAAEDYKEAWEEYNEELETYLKELEARKPKEESVDEESATEDSKDKKGEQDPESKPDKDKEEKTDEPKPKDEDPEKKDEKNAAAVSLKDSSTAFERKGGKKDKNNDKPNGKSASNDKKKDGEKKEGEDELKKPQKPAFDLSKEMLVKALDGEAALHVEVHRAADILAVLEVKSKFYVDLVLVGCTEGHLVLDALEEAKVSVILGQTESLNKNVNSGLHNRVPDLASRLHEKGIPFAISSTGAGGQAIRRLSLKAARAAGQGLDPKAALEAVTSQPAEILGVSDRIGSLAKGKDADIVLFSGAPLDSDARIERVLISGVEVFTREK